MRLAPLDKTHSADSDLGDRPREGPSAPTVGIAVIGLGYWGPNLVRNFNAADGARVRLAVDLDSHRVQSICQHYPTVRGETDYLNALSDSQVNAIVVATPPATHFEIAKQALEAGKHVLVEKPLAETAVQATQLIEIAEAGDLTLMVDHTFIYTSAVRKAAELLHDGSMGEVYYYDAIRANLGLFQQDVNVVWDLAVHDLSIMDYLLAQEPTSVRAMGARHVDASRENLAYLHFRYEGNLIGHVNVSWLAPVKVRLTMIGGSKRMIVYDDTEASEKIKVYDKGVVLNTNENRFRTLFDYRSGDMWAPKLDQVEALFVGAQHFIDCVRTGEKPVTDGHAGLRVVRALEAAQRSLDEGGREVLLSELG